MEHSAHSVKMKFGTIIQLLSYALSLAFLDMVRQDSKIIQHSTSSSSSTGAVALGGGLFLGGDDTNAVRAHFNCTGDEDNIATCAYNTISYTNKACDYAVAVCQGTMLTL